MAADDESGQALILALGGAFVLLAGALALVAIAGAVTGKGRVAAGGRPGGDLGRALDARRPAAAARAADACRTGCRTRPTSTRPPTWRGRGRRRSTRRGRTGSTRSGSASPSRTPLVRAGAGEGDGGRPPRGWGGSGREVEASAVAEAAAPAAPPAAIRRWPAAAATAARSSTATARGCVPTSPPPSTGWRPRPAPTASPCSSSPASAPTPNRRRSSPPTPTRPGWRRRATRCTAARPSSTSGPNPPTAGWPPTPAASASSSATPGRPGTTASTPARRPARRRATRSAPAGEAALAAAATLPAFVPARFRDPLLAAAARWNVSAALLAAQLMAESGFDPYAVSPAGAQGIAQFMPGTAASYGLADPFDPVAAIDAQAHLMSDLIRQFGSPELALAAYNAGPGAVEACHCVPRLPRDPGLRHPHPRPARRRRRACSCRASKCGWSPDLGAAATG